MAVRRINLLHYAFSVVVMSFGGKLMQFPPGDVKYDLSKILKKFIQLRHFTIFQVLMESESDLHRRKGLSAFDRYKISCNAKIIVPGGIRRKHY